MRYSCIHWVNHLIDYYSDQAPGPEEGSLGRIIYGFFSETYLYWLEALSLFGSISEGILAISKLEYILQVSLSY